MKMKKQVFFRDLVEYMEIEPVNIDESTIFSDLEDYDSMAAMSIVALADEKFEVTLSAEQLQNMKTVQDLMELIGLQHFES